MMTRIGFYLGKLLIRTFIRRLHLDLYTFAVSFNLHLFDHKTSKSIRTRMFTHSLKSKSATSGSKMMIFLNHSQSFLIIPVVTLPAVSRAQMYPADLRLRKYRFWIFEASSKRSFLVLSWPRGKLADR